MVLYGLTTQGQQQLLLLQQRYAMMEHHLQQQQQHSPTSPGQRSMKDEQILRSNSRKFNCVYFTDAKPAAFNLNPEGAALCANSSHLPSHRTFVSSSGSVSSSSPTPSGNAASSTISPSTTTTTRTSFMISDILDSPSSRSGARTCSSSTAPDESNGGYCDDPSNGRDSPRSVVSDDAEGKEREDSIGASDSDVERSGQSGTNTIIIIINFM